MMKATGFRMSFSFSMTCVLGNMWSAGKQLWITSISFTPASFGKPRCDRPGSAREGSFLNFASKELVTFLISPNWPITSACNRKM
eukprot:12897837-Prorocentrum_lima.AAC.1